LEKGKFIAPTNSTMAFHLNRQLKSCCGSIPVDLLSEEGIKATWRDSNGQGCSTLTPTQAKKARIQFVREHPELHEDPKALAKALIAAELYSDTTEVYVVAKQVPRMIREAKQ